MIPTLSTLASTTVVESCWGWLGYENLDDLKSEANAMAEHEHEEQKKRNGQALMQKSLQEVMA